jgi:hypothetical protein
LSKITVTPDNGPFGCTDKPAEKHCCLICYKRKILFRLKKQAEKIDYKLDEQSQLYNELLEKVSPKKLPRKKEYVRFSASSYKIFRSTVTFSFIFGN